MTGTVDYSENEKHSLAATLSTLTPGKNPKPLNPKLLNPLKPCADLQRECRCRSHPGALLGLPPEQAYSEDSSQSWALG